MFQLPLVKPVPFNIFSSWEIFSSSPRYHLKLLTGFVAELLLWYETHFKFCSFPGFNHREVIFPPHGLGWSWEISLMLSKMIGNILMGCLTIYLVVACSGIMNIKSVTKILIKWFHQPGIFWEYSDGHCIWWRSPILATVIRYLVTEKITPVANRDSENGARKEKILKISTQSMR